MSNVEPISTAGSEVQGGTTIDATPNGPMATAHAEREVKAHQANH